MREAPQTHEPTATDTPIVPDGFHIAVVRNDGSFELWEKAFDETTTLAGFAQRGVFKNCCWRGAKPVSVIETRYVGIRSRHDHGDVYHYAASLAAEMNGITSLLARLDRDEYGLFTCPHCGKHFSYSGSFRSHLHQECNDSGAAMIVNLGDHLRRNHASPAGWQKGRAA